MSMGNFLEAWSQAILVGIFLVGRLGVRIEESKRSEYQPVPGTDAHMNKLSQKILSKFLMSL